MKANSSTYRYHLWTGSGSSTTDLVFAEDNAVDINQVSHWMGPTREEYKFSCLHQPISENHGFLRVIKIEDNQTGEEIYSEPAIDYGEDIYGLELSLPGELPEREIVYEYIKLHEPEFHISGDRVLDDMRLTGSAEWNDTFDLFLFLLPLTNIPEDTELSTIISSLDKMKMELVTQQ